MGSPMVYPMVLCMRMDVNDGKRRERCSEQDSREIITTRVARLQLRSSSTMPTPGASSSISTLRSDQHQIVHQSLSRSPAGRRSIFATAHHQLPARISASCLVINLSSTDDCATEQYPTSNISWQPHSSPCGPDFMTTASAVQLLLSHLRYRAQC
jgi:hypothetical protein